MTPVDPDKTKRLMVSVDHEIADRITVLAKKERRSLANWLLCAVMEKLERDEKG